MLRREGGGAPKHISFSVIEEKNIVNLTCFLKYRTPVIRFSLFIQVTIILNK